MTKTSVSLLAAAFAVVAVPAFAADLSQPAVAAAPAAASSLAGVSLSIEGAPEFSQNWTSPKYGDLVDSYYIGGITYKLDPNWTVGATFKDQENAVIGVGGAATHEEFATGTLGYTLPLNETVSLTATGGIGLAWGTTNYNNNAVLANGQQSFFYYQGALEADIKITPQLTWNALNVQYKNAFNVDYLNPSAFTGLTYAIDKHNAVQTKLNYSWYDNGAGASNLVGNKESISLGYKYSF